MLINKSKIKSKLIRRFFSDVNLSIKAQISSDDKYKIIQYGFPHSEVYRKKSRPINNYAITKYSNVYNKLVKAAIENQQICLSMNQINSNERIFCMIKDLDNLEFKADYYDLYINPKIEYIDPSNVELDYELIDSFK